MKRKSLGFRKKLGWIFRVIGAHTHIYYIYVNKIRSSQTARFYKLVNYFVGRKTPKLDQKRSICGKRWESHLLP